MKSPKIEEQSVAWSLTIEFATISGLICSGQPRILAWVPGKPAATCRDAASAKLAIDRLPLASFNLKLQLNPLDQISNDSPPSAGGTPEKAAKI
jgi:hypothetical protein